MTKKATDTLTKLALSSELLERAAEKAKLLGQITRSRKFHAAMKRALNAEIKSLLGPGFHVERGSTRVRAKRVGSGQVYSGQNNRGG